MDNITIKNYNLISKEYESRYYTKENKDNQNIEELLKKIIKNYNIKSVIEYGCGTAYWISIMDKYGVGYLYGIDGANQMLDKAKTKKYKNEVRFSCIDLIKKQAIINQKFDLGIAIFFISTLRYEDIDNILNMVNINLNKDGIFVIVDNTLPFNVNKEIYTLHLKEEWSGNKIECIYNLYSTHWMINHLTKNGFYIINTNNICEDIQTIICKKI